MAVGDTRTMSAFLDHIDSIYDSLGAAEPPHSENIESQGRGQEDHTRLPSIVVKADSSTSHSGVPYTTDYQRRKREEVRELKAEAQRLRAQLGEMLRKHHGRIGETTALSGTNKRCSWQVWAILECEKRLRSECSNRKLRAMLSEQLRLFASMRRVLGRNDSLEEINFVRKLQPTTDRALIHFDCRDSVFNELSSKLKGLRLNVDAVLPPPSEDFQVVLRSQAQENESGEHCVDTTAVTPMACSYQQTVEMLWNYSVSGNTKKAEVAYIYAQLQAPVHWKISNGRSWAMTVLVRNANGMLSRVDAVVTFQRYEEENRVVQVGAISWFLQSEGLQFHDRYWITVSPSQVHPEHESVLRVYQQLKSRIGDNKKTTPAGAAVMRTIGAGSRGYLQGLQDQFLEQVSPMRTHI